MKKDSKKEEIKRFYYAYAAERGKRLNGKNIADLFRWFRKRKSLTKSYKAAELELLNAVKASVELELRIEDMLGDFDDNHNHRYQRKEELLGDCLNSISRVLSDLY